ncbi:hypothetical protein [Methylobacterium radiodurans]|uniref:hypothetical protein n=1 Tax=Methylobacterium radiodurans TaxID=2202828 RepID=UPI0013A5B73C|nr:hypothetical protein [Methylobacterium radiodurans]
MTTLLDRAVARADDLMRKSERALASARLLHEHGDSEGTCCLAFYAMFYAAQTAC